MSTEGKESGYKGCYDAGFKKGIEKTIESLILNAVGDSISVSDLRATYHCLESRTEQEIFDPSDTIYPDHYYPVPDCIIGNILDHWELIPGDTKQDLKDELTAFYTAMERLTDWIHENR